jgi:hypothetical protein
MKRSNHLSIAGGAGVTAALVCAASTASGQEAIRSARAGDYVTDAHKRAVEAQAYNLPAGPAQMRLNANWLGSYNDNISLVATNRESDYVNELGVDLGGFWAVGGANSLALDLGIGYVKYGAAREQDYIRVTPNSGVSFDYKAGAVSLNVHDRVQHLQDPSTEPTLSGVGEFGRLENIAGLRADWEISSIVLTLGYDHYNFWATTQAWEYLDHSSELLYARATFAKYRRDRFGVELGGGITDYGQNVMNDNTHFSVGIFWDTAITDSVDLAMSVGYVVYQFDQGGTIGDNSDPDAVYGNVTLQHRACSFFTHALSGGTQTQLGYTANTVDISYIRYRAVIDATEKLSLQPQFLFEHAVESGATGERADRFGAGLRIGYRITDDITAHCDYLFLNKDSNLPDRGYFQNRIAVDVTYQF